MSQGQRHINCCVFCLYDPAWNSWPGFTKCHSLDGATSLLPAKVIGVTRRQYLALARLDGFVVSLFIDYSLKFYK